MRKLIGLFALAVALNAQAIMPPIVTATACDSLQFSWSTPTTRVDGSPLLSSEIAKYTLYLTNEPAGIDIPAPAALYTYKIKSGYTTTAADTASITVTDTAGLPSAGSASVPLPVGSKCPKSGPSAPPSMQAVKK